MGRFSESTIFRVLNTEWLATRTLQSGLRNGMVARAQRAPRNDRARFPQAGRRRVGKGRRSATQPSLLRRVGWIVWTSPRHAALALATALACGAVASRVNSVVAPPYAAILGATLLYPALIALWRRMPRAGWRRSMKNNHPKVIAAALAVNDLVIRQSNSPQRRSCE